MRNLTIGALALGLTAATALPAAAAPVHSSTATLSQAVQSDVTQVRWRGHRHGGWGGAALGAGLGFAAGALIGSAAANSHYYGGPYAYDPGYYGGPVYAAPPARTYVAPAPNGACRWITTGGDGRYGYWTC
jgi:hypothetical protein